MRKFIVACLSALTLAACDSGGGGSGGCVEGQPTTCDCDGGASGARTCGAEGPCLCGGDGGAVETDGSSGPGGDGGVVEPDAGGPGGDAGCVPDCAGRACGDDGCGVSCGACAGGDVCDQAGQCVAPPAACGDGACGDGEDCAACAADCACAMGRACNAGVCEVRACEGAACGAPPRILAFDADARRLTEGGLVRFSAVVTDPDGVADVIGGLLEDPDGVSYGAFAAAGGEGAYELSLSWGAIHAARPVEFEGSAARDFVGVFFDEAGNRVTETLQITLHCDAAGGVACAGRCTDLNDAEHCGACRAACDGTCRDRQCDCRDGLARCGGACVDTDVEPAHCGRCDDACEAPPGGSPVCAGGECGVRCDPGRAACGGACAECPAEHVAATACDGARCVATACEDDALLCDGACAVCPTENVEQHGCRGQRCVATACREGFHACAEGCCPWRFGDVAPATGRFALALDGAGRPHVVVGARRRVDLARFDAAAGEWDVAEVAPIEAEVQADPDVALAFAGDTPYVGYSWFTPPPAGGASTGELRFLRRDGAAWVELGSRRDTGLDVPRGPTLASDDRGAVHACYENNRMWCSPLPGFAPAQVTEVRAQEAHLVFDGPTPHVTWRHFAGNTLGYATRVAGWQVETANPAPGSGFAPRVAASAAGPVMLHHTEAGELWWTRRDGAAWRSERVVGDVVVGGDFDVATDAQGEPLVCVATDRGLRLVRRVAGRWREEPVFAQAARRCRVAVTPDGALHLVYVDPSRNFIRHAR
jgi:hypothetical protein